MEREIKLTAMEQMPGDPADLLVYLAVKDGVGPYRFGVAEAVAIRDVYYDTSGGRLRAARVGLRVRRQGSRARITVKGREVWWGALAERLEVEEDLTEAGLARALQPLVDQGLLPPDPVPLEGLLAGGPAGPLVPILVTDTRRVNRPVYRPPSPDPVAVLSLDRVTYPGLPGEPVFHDVEVEALPGATDADLAELQSLLIEAAGGYLKPAPESKLARGLRLGRGA